MRLGNEWEIEVMYHPKWSSDVSTQEKKKQVENWPWSRNKTKYKTFSWLWKVANRLERLFFFLPTVHGRSFFQDPKKPRPACNIMINPGTHKYTLSLLKIHFNDAILNSPKTWQFPHFFVRKSMKTESEAYIARKRHVADNVFPSSWK